jgi:hypothetical protein
MNDNLYNPFAWLMFPIALYAAVLQAVLCPDQSEFYDVRKEPTRRGR